MAEKVLTASWQRCRVHFLRNVLADLSFPAAHRVKRHSTHPLQRLNGEIKRRTKVVGIFPNEAAITRLVGAILLEQNDEWAVQRARCMTRETMTEMLEPPAIHLPAAAGRIPELLPGQDALR